MDMETQHLVPRRIQVSGTIALIGQLIFTAGIGIAYAAPNAHWDRGAGLGWLVAGVIVVGVATLLNSPRGWEWVVSVIPKHHKGDAA